MVAKEIFFKDESRSKMMTGITTLAEAVKLTLGPKGRNVIIEKTEGTQIVTKDGVSVAHEVFFKDKLANIGAQLVKEVAFKTARDAGDGTTTATILAEGIIREGLKYVAAGMNPMDLKRGIDKAVSAALEELDKMKKPVSSNIEIIQVGSVSANNDEEIGKLIANAMHQVGQHGLISVEDGRGLKDELDVVEGMQFNRGFLSPYFVTHQEKAKCQLDDPYVLVTDKKISALKDLLPLLEHVAKQGKQLLIIAEDVDGEALATLVINSMRGILKTCAVKAPEFGNIRKNVLEDIAVITGATVISDDKGLTLDKVTLDLLGKVSRVEIDKDFTTLIDGGGDKDKISERVKNLLNQYEEAPQPYDKENLQKRIAKLSGGVAVIKVGAPSEVEMKEKKDRIDDALHATRAAVEDGVVAGGGVALLRTKQAIESVKGSNTDQDAGIKIILKAIETPLRTIAENAGVSADVVVNKVLEGEGNFGYNAATDTYGDLLEMGVVDPTKVTKKALQNAASVAGMFLTTDCSITVLPASPQNNAIQASM